MMFLFKELNKNFVSLLCSLLVWGSLGLVDLSAGLQETGLSSRMEDEVGELEVAEAPACGQSSVLSICPSLLLLKGFN